MPSRTEVITPNLLRDWPLPSGADSKYARGNVVVVGGARKTPGGVLLAGVRGTVGGTAGVDAQ